MRGRDAQLRLSTDFDDVIEPPALPVSFTRGDDPAVQLMDGFVRGRAILGRFGATPGLVGFRVAAGAGPVDVTVRLRADDVSATWWTSRVAERLGIAGDPSGPRLLQVRSQGLLRGAVLLCRAPGAQSGTSVRGEVSFRLEPVDLPADGLLLVEVTDPPPPEWDAQSTVLTHAGVGVETTAVLVAPALEPQPEPERGEGPIDAVTAERLGWLSTGDLPPPTGSGARTVRAGVFVVEQPDGAPAVGGMTVELSPRGRQEQPRSSRWGRGGSEPAEAPPLSARAASMVDGSAVDARLATVAGGLRLTLVGARPGPVQVHLTPADGPGWDITTMTHALMNST